MKVYYSLPMYYGASYKLFRFAQQMRETPTLSEKRLEEVLSVKHFKQYNFRRQHPIADYIADFYSHSLKLVIEVDGSYHDLEEQNQYDKFRDEDMEQFGITVLRFSNQQVLEEIENVKQNIEDSIEHHKPAAKKHSTL